MPRDPFNPETGRSYLEEDAERLQKAKGPAETAISPSHGPTTSQEGTAMDAASNTTAPAGRAMVPPGFQKSVDDISYALNDLRMFASILETLAETKLENEANPDLWNMPKGFTGSVLHTNEADEILFLVLKVENMARKVDGMWDALLEAMPAVEERAA